MANITRYQTSRGETRWRVRYRKPDGTQTDKRGFRRKVDAERWAAERVTIAKAQGSFIDPQAGRVTVETLWPAWIAAKKTRCKASYAATLEGEWRQRVSPKWGKREVASITHAEVQEWAGTLTGGGCSPSVVLRAHGILRSILKQAMRDRLIAADPCDGVELPRKRRKEHRYLTADELLRLADESDWRRPIILTLGLTGIRWGEMAGLTVADVDLQRRRLWIRRSATEVNGRIVVDTPKSDKWRQVAFPAFLDATVDGLVAGRDGSAPLFESPDGGLVRRTHGPNTSSSWFYWARRRAGIEGEMTLHDLRHTAASLMVHAGANVKAVQRQLGHASAAMTLDVYADLFDDDLDVVGAAMDAMLTGVGKMWATQGGGAVDVKRE